MSKDKACTNILVDLFHCLTVLTWKINYFLYPFWAPSSQGCTTCCLLPTKSPWAFSTELLTSQSVPSLCGFLFTRCRTLHLSLLNFIGFLSARCSSLCRLKSGTILQHIDCSSFLCHLWTWWDHTVPPSPDHWY